MKLLFLYLSLILFVSPVYGANKLNVITTTTTLKSIVESIGGPLVSVNSITKGPQDPHFIEAKPSYMVKARKANLLVAVGLELEVGWLPHIIRGSRNPKIVKGKAGYLDASSFITAIDSFPLLSDRSQGHIHRLGNPHFLLDPLKTIKVAKGISERLISLDNKNRFIYESNFKKFEQQILDLHQNWTTRIKKTSVEKVMTYHKTLNYFLKRYNLEHAGSIEAKPGIPPTAKHLISLVKKANQDKVTCILNESFFETNAGKRIQKSAPLHLEVVPTEVYSTPKATSYINLIEQLVLSVENCSKQLDK